MRWAGHAVRMYTIVNVGEVVTWVHGGTWEGNIEMDLGKTSCKGLYLFFSTQTMLRAVETAKFSTANRLNNIGIYI
jgi:hypothetical protein